MTNRDLASGNLGPGNIKEGRYGRPRRINADTLAHFAPAAEAARKNARWDAEGFEKGSKEGQWTYTWSGDFPVITLTEDVRVVEGKIVVGIFVEYAQGAIDEIFSRNTHPGNIAPRLDDIIFQIMQHDAGIVDSEVLAADFLETEGVTAVPRKETRFSRPLWHYRQAVYNLEERHNIDHDTAAEMYQQRD